MEVSNACETTRHPRIPFHQSVVQQPLKCFSNILQQALQVDTNTCTKVLIYLRSICYCNMRVFDFLGLPEHKLAKYKKLNSGSYTPISDLLRQRLSEYFQPHNYRLEEYLGMKFNW